MEFWEWLQGALRTRPMALDWQGRGRSQNVEDRRNETSYGSYAEAKIGSREVPTSMPISIVQPRSSWNERLSNDLVRTPPTPRY